LETVYVRVKPSNLIIRAHRHKASLATGSSERVMKREAGETPALFPQL
jgi:hypothetical protein